MISPKARRNISRIIPFGLIWFVFSIIYFVLEKGLLGDLNVYPSTGNPYKFDESVFFSAVTALLLGLLFGTIEIVYVSKLFIQKSLGRKILYKIGIYVFFMFFFLLITSSIGNAIRLQTNIHIFFVGSKWHPCEVMCNDQS